MKVRTLLVAAIVFVYLLPTAANADFDYPKLPWYEKLFFPIGAWSYPYYECVPDSTYVDPNPDDDWESPKADITWSDWNARFNAINFDEYHNLGLDYAKPFVYYYPYKVGESGVSGPEKTTYEKRLYKNIL